MRGAVLFLAFTAAYSLSLSQPAAAQSFGCNRASTQDQITICQNPHLLRLDEHMVALFVRAHQYVGPHGARDLAYDQDRWARHRARCGPNPHCIEDAYRRRIDELRSYRGRY